MKVLVTTSGTGSRLGALTKNTNKALVPIAGKPAISYILDLYSADIPLVITVGYLANQVRDFFKTHYTDRDITFVDVDKYEGDGSSLAYSLLQAEPYLQEPFIFHACDTIVLDTAIPAPDKNWIAGHAIPGDVSQYRTIQADMDNIITRINDKKEGDSHNVLIGLFGIKDYELYWNYLKALYAANPNDQTLNDTSPFNDMISEGISISLVPFPIWLDTGNPPALAKTEEHLQKNNSTIA